MESTNSSAPPPSQPNPRQYAAAKQEEKDNAAVLLVTKQGLVLNVALACGKLGVGLASNSPAMIADAAHSFSDIATDFVTLYSYDIARRPPDWDHPFGHGKFESVGTVVVGSLLVATGLGVGFHSLTVLYSHPAAVDLSEMAWIGQEWAAAAAAVSMLSKEAMYRATLVVGRRAGSSVVVANAHHHRSDALSSGVALLGIGGGALLGTPLLDPLAGVVVAFMVLKGGIEVTREAAADLLDSQIPNELLVEIAHLCSAVPGVQLQSSKSLRGRRMGPHILLDVAITVDGRITASAAHQLGEHVRVAILRKFAAIKEVRIHCDPDPREEWDGQTLLDPQELIEQKVRNLLKKCDPLLLGVSEIMVTYNRNHKISLKVDLIMHPSMTIREANNLGGKVRDLLLKVADVEFVDVDLELSEDSAANNQLVVIVNEEQKDWVVSPLGMTSEPAPKKNEVPVLP